MKWANIGVKTYSFIHSCKKHLPKAYYIPGPYPSAGDTTVDKIEKKCAQMEFPFYQEKADEK